MNYRKTELLLACLESLGPALAEVAGETEVVVVDNGSGDGALERVRNEFPHVATIGLLSWARRRPDVGSRAAQMRFATGPGVLNSAGITWTASDRLLGEPVESSETEPVEVFGACGGAALYRRDMWQELDGLDASFFIFGDDVDLSWRAPRVRRCWRSQGRRTSATAAAITRRRLAAPLPEDSSNGVPAAPAASLDAGGGVGWIALLLMGTLGAVLAVAGLAERRRSG